MAHQGTGFPRPLSQWDTAMTPPSPSCTHQLNFTWSGINEHDVALTKTPGVCADYTPLCEPVTKGNFTIVMEKPGVYGLACSVTDHCDDGQNIVVTVT